MKSASAMSMLIRAKKKKMMEDPDVVSLSGIPEDATDLMIKKQHTETDDLDENIPKVHSEMNEASAAEEHAEEKLQDNHLDKEDMHDENSDDGQMKRKARIAKMMSK